MESGIGLCDSYRLVPHRPTDLTPGALTDEDDAVVAESAQGILARRNANLVRNPPFLVEGSGQRRAKVKWEISDEPSAQILA